MHVVVNNQVGFTTGPGALAFVRVLHRRREDDRRAPIFHVNGDDPEACVWVAQLAVDFREKFGKDVVIDLICYRRRGHNEGDDPSMTQPAMYDLIDTKRSVRKSLHRGADRPRATSRSRRPRTRCATTRASWSGCSTRFVSSRSSKPEPSESVELDQTPLARLTTAVDAATLAVSATRSSTCPTLHGAPARQAGHREAQGDSREGHIDWAFAELLAFGSLAEQGALVRLAGQDSRRGTFTQRHSVLIDRKTGDEYNPIAELATAADNGGKFMVYDSALTECSRAWAFEYGVLGRQPRRPRAVGGAVRRLRQRRADHHRRVHLVR